MCYWTVFRRLHWSTVPYYVAIPEFRLDHDTSWLLAHCYVLWLPDKADYQSLTHCLDLETKTMNLKHSTLAKYLQNLLQKKTVDTHWSQNIWWELFTHINETTLLEIHKLCFVFTTGKDTVQYYHWIFLHSRASTCKKKYIKLTKEKWRGKGGKTYDGLASHPGE